MNATSAALRRFLQIAMLAAFSVVIADATSACSVDSNDFSEEREAGKGDVIAFVNAELVSMTDDRVRSGYTVVIEDDRIVAVGPADQTEVPNGATRIDASGLYLMPGLAEMHGHVPNAAGNQAAVDETLFLYAATGITTVRGMLGYPGQLSLADRVISEDLFSPTLYLAGPSFNGGSVSSPEQAEAMVRAQHAEGWHLLKIHPGLSRAEFDAVANTANELGIRFGGHVPADVGLDHAIAKGQETFDHLDGYVQAIADENGIVSSRDVDRLVQLTIDAGAWVVPTMVLWETLYGTNSLNYLQSFEELKYVSEAAVTSWSNQYQQRVNIAAYDPVASQNVIDSRMQILRALNDAGARILMGTDAPQQFSVPGFSLHREIKTMVDAGMSPYEVIKSGTQVVGDYFSNEDEFGTIEPGKRADLVLVRGNPLSDVNNIANREGVMVRGIWMSGDEIDRRLAEIAASK